MWKHGGKTLNLMSYGSTVIPPSQDRMWRTFLEGFSGQIGAGLFVWTGPLGRARPKLDNTLRWFVVCGPLRSEMMHIKLPGDSSGSSWGVWAGGADARWWCPCVSLPANGCKRLHLWQQFRWLTADEWMAILPSCFKNILTSPGAHTGGTSNIHKILLDLQGSKLLSLTDHCSVPLYGFSGAMRPNKPVWPARCKHNIWGIFKGWWKNKGKRPGGRAAL